MLAKNIVLDQILGVRKLVYSDFILYLCKIIKTDYLI